MFTKKEFRTLLISGSMIFLLTFILFWGYFYYEGMREPLTQTPEDEGVTTFLEVQSPEDMIELTYVPDQEQAVKVTPYTKVVLQMMDASNSLVAEEQITNLALAGMTKEKLAQTFKDYKIVTFSESRVVLQKQLQQAPIPPSYTLVVQQGVVGILEHGTNPQFISLNLQEDTFAPIDLALFEGDGLPITAKQKVQLQQQPYYIEQILQNYNE